jgi:dolichol-phosphate mannosyltransferase
MSKISIVAPAFNEVELVGEFVRRVCAAVEPTGHDYEIVLVDDGSRDGTFARVEELHAANDRVKGVRLSRNFGQEAAVQAGLDSADGDAVVLMDSDLQDPPELIPQMIERWQGGAQVVVAERARRAERFARRLATRLFHWLFRRMSRFDEGGEVGLFSLLDRRVVEVMRRMPERHRYLRGLRAYAGFRRGAVTYERPRRDGEPRQSLSKLMRIAADGLFSFSYLPLRLATLLGLGTSTCAFAYLAVVLYFRLFTDKAQVGWASTLGATLLIGGVQLVAIGIIGEYLGRIYEEVKRRPNYIVERTVGLDAADQCGPPSWRDRRADREPTDAAVNSTPAAATERE